MKRCYLTIDHGNSVAKMSLYCDDAIVETTTATSVTARGVADFVSGRPLGGIIVASVAGYDTALASQLDSLAPLVVEMTPFTPVPIAIDYASQATLGVDRIAAAVAAAEMCPSGEIVVVDAGTAITIDYVDATATYRGGNIAPGLAMQLEALHSRTARLPLVAAPSSLPDEPALTGDDTFSSILSGCLLSMAGAVDYFAAHAPAQGTGTALVITGGNGHLLIPYLRHRNPRLVPHLVENGLYRILRYNENI